MKKRIYFTHATAYEFKAELYEPLKNSKFYPQYEFMLPHEHTIKAVNSKESIKTAALILAEISYPSTGQGIELGWANMYNKPIFCFHQVDKPYSTSLNLISKNIFAYHDNTEFLKQLEMLLIQQLH